MIDIKELRIGSSVLYEGERVKICGTADFKKFDPGVALYTNEGIMLNVRVGQLSPIPITEELLKGMGFECLWGVPKEMEKHIGEIGLYSTHLNNGKYRISISNDDSTNYGNILCQYLHELETFVYLTTKKELI